MEEKSPVMPPLFERLVDRGDFEIGQEEEKLVSFSLKWLDGAARD